MSEEEILSALQAIAFSDFTEYIWVEDGEVRVKVSEGHGTIKRKIEHDDLSRISKETGLQINIVRESVCHPSNSKI